MTSSTGREDRTAEDPAIILAVKRAGLDRWSRGYPDGFLETTNRDVAYFDPFVEWRVNGHEALEVLYEAARGKVRIDRYEMIGPRVEVSGDMAVLTWQVWHCRV
jgi:hypothetical protein